MYIKVFPRVTKMMGFDVQWVTVLKLLLVQEDRLISKVKYSGVL